jgi:hypothetical protein
MYLCTMPLSLAHITVMNGISVTSKELTAHTIHALSHFVSKEWNFNAVAMDIACECDSRQGGWPIS